MSGNLNQIPYHGSDTPSFDRVFCFRGSLAHLFIGSASYASGSLMTVICKFCTLINVSSIIHALVKTVVTVMMSPSISA